MSHRQNESLTVGECASLAMVFEASAPKPGNVHRGADFEDLTYVQMIVSASVVARHLNAAPNRRLGETVLAAVRATRAAVGTNSNLGTLLLIAPLAKVPRNVSLGEGVADILDSLQLEDTRDVYEAIRLAQPGGLGHSDEADVADEPRVGLVEAMRLAADRDLVARQYVCGFSQVLDEVAPWLKEGVARGWPLATAIVHAHLRLMAAYPDSLIVRKLGASAAQEASDRSMQVLSSGSPGDEAYERALADLDFWLRSDHHRRNPGTTADLIAAGLFVGLLEGEIDAATRFYRG